MYIPIDKINAEAEIETNLTNDELTSKPDS